MHLPKLNSHEVVAGSNSSFIKARVLKVDCSVGLTGEVIPIQYQYTTDLFYIYNAQLWIFATLVVQGGGLYFAHHNICVVIFFHGYDVR